MIDRNFLIKLNLRLQNTIDRLEWEVREFKNLQKIVFDAIPFPAEKEEEDKNDLRTF